MTKFKEIVKKIFVEEKRSFFKRFGFALLVDFVFAFSIFAFVPYEVYMGNTNEFTFTLGEFFAPLLLAATVFIITFIVHLLLKGKLFNLYTSAVFGVTVAGYVQSMFLNGLMKSLNGTQDIRSTGKIIINLIIWLIVLIAPAIISFIKEDIWSALCKIGSVIIAGAQIVAIFSLLLTMKAPNIETRISTKGLYDVSKANNVIVLVLDKFDQAYVDPMLKVYPDAFDCMNGFTYYPNTSGKYTFTHLGVPFLLTGVDIPEYDPTEEQFVEQMDNSKFFNFIIKNAGSVAVYTNEFCIRSDKARDKIENCIKLDYNISNMTLAKASMKSSLYRTLPFAFKDRFVYDSASFNDAVEFLENSNITGFSSDFHTTEQQMMEHLTSNGLNINEEYGDSCYKFIHLKGTHEFWQLTEDVKYSEKVTSMEETAKGVMTLVGEYCNQLDKLGLFEDSTIFVTADHGFAGVWNLNDGLPRVVNPLLMYKPAGVSRDEPLKTDISPASQDDIFANIVNALGGDGSEFGKTIEEASKDKNRERYFYGAFQDPEITDRESCIHVEYRITGDARNIENWEETGNRIYPNNNPKHKNNK